MLIYSFPLILDQCGMKILFFFFQKNFFPPTDPQKSWNVTGNDNIFCPALHHHHTNNQQVVCLEARNIRQKMKHGMVFYRIHQALCLQTFHTNELHLDIVIQK